MKARPTPLTLPESRQFWSHEVPGRGAHHFRAPYYGVGQALFQLATRYHVDPATDDRSSQERSVAMLPYMGAVIGACWRHRGIELEAALPLTGLTPDALEAYGSRVAEELQDADYNLLDILQIFGAIMPEVTRRHSLVEMAAERARFTEPPRDGSISS